MADLVASGRLLGAADTGWSRKAAYRIARVPARGETVLDECLDLLAAENQPVKVDKAVGICSRDVRDRVTERLMGSGLLVSQPSKVFGLFTRQHYFGTTLQAAGIRRRIAAALTDRTSSDPYVTELIALLAAGSLLHKVIDAELVHMTTKQLKRAGKEYREADPISAAVHRRIQNAVAAAGSVAAMTAAVSAS